MAFCNNGVAKTARGIATLLSEMFADSHGEFSPSIYETGRLVSTVPSLTGHTRRLSFLLDHQHADGGWGGSAEYGLVPTLSATEALLSVLKNMPARNGPALNYLDVVASADRGLRSLFDRLNTGAPAPLPDTVAVEIVVPGLIAEINAHLDRLAREPLTGLDAWPGARLGIPAGANLELLAGLRDVVRRGGSLPTKLLHSLEVIGDAARGAAFVQPVRGCVGCSPAATATWLGDKAVRVGRHPAVDYLAAVQDRGGGPVPVAAPLAPFERAWVLATLGGAGRTVAVPNALVRNLQAAFGPHGVAGGPGLPPDVDDTATALHALARLGRPRRPDCLWEYRSGRHFMCYPAERTPSASANAHVLQALGVNAASHMDTVAMLTGWLCDRQEPDGYWSDKWHASPYYATPCCVLALAEHGGAAAAGAVHRAARWVLDTQQPDGSWGRWAGTHEETAYAVRILLRTKTSDLVDPAIARGCQFLLCSAGGEHPPLWHDKDLYTPGRIVRVEGMVAVRLALADPGIAALLAEVDTRVCESG